MVYKYEASPIVLLIPHGQQSINQSINRTVYNWVRLQLQLETAIERDTNKYEIWSPFLKSSDFSGVFGVT